MNALTKNKLSIVFKSRQHVLRGRVTQPLVFVKQNNLYDMLTCKYFVKLFFKQ